jgi:acetyl-CoA carboxylase biotin carboxyl carrier protein
MTLTAKDVAEITRLLEDSSFEELDLDIDGFRIRLTRNGAARNADSSLAPAEREASQPAARPPASAPAARPTGGPGLTDVVAPLLGTFYRAPRPGAPPFVEVGGAVEPQTIVGIIEVMKLMTTVRAGAAGVVREILARDGELVEYGATLMRLSKT